MFQVGEQTRMMKRLFMQWALVRLAERLARNLVDLARRFRSAQRLQPKERPWLKECLRPKKRLWSEERLRLEEPPQLIGRPWRIDETVPVRHVVLWCLCGSMAIGQVSAEDVAWPEHGLNSAETRYSPLQDINRDTVADLGLAWSHTQWELGEDSKPRRSWSIGRFMSAVRGVRFTRSTR